MSDINEQPDSPADNVESKSGGAASVEAIDAASEVTKVGVAPPDDPLDEAKKAAAKYKDQALRALADFDNFRKRARKENEDAKKSGKEDFLKEFLPIFDNVERAILSAEKATDVKGVVDGLKMVLRQLGETFSRVGVTRTPGIGNMFDPQVHEAIQQVETEEHPPGTIIAEVQPGYLNGERLIRPAMVVVAKPVSPGGDEPTEPS